MQDAPFTMHLPQVGKPMNSEEKALQELTVKVDMYINMIYFLISIIFIMMIVGWMIR